MSIAIWRRSWWDLIVIGALSRSRIVVSLESRRQSTSTSSSPSALDSCRSVKLFSVLYLTVHLIVWQNEKTKNHSSTRWHCSYFALSLMKNVVHWMTTMIISGLSLLGSCGWRSVSLLWANPVISHIMSIEVLLKLVIIFQYFQEFSLKTKFVLVFATSRWIRSLDTVRSVTLCYHDDTFGAVSKSIRLNDTSYQRDDDQCFWDRNLDSCLLPVYARAFLLFFLDPFWILVDDSFKKGLYQGMDLPDYWFFWYFPSWS